MAIDSFDISFSLPGSEVVTKRPTINKINHQKKRVLNKKESIPINPKQKKHKKRVR